MVGILKEQFEMVGMNKLLEGLEMGSEEIEFEAFSQLFSEEEGGDNSTLM